MDAYLIGSATFRAAVATATAKLAWPLVATRSGCRLAVCALWQLIRPGPGRRHFVLDPAVPALAAPHRERGQIALLRDYAAE